jgi:uncharacterized membrane protein YkgB
MKLICITEQISRLDRVAAVITRIALVLVTVWIGGLKVSHYEAEGVVPYVANSPFLRWLFKYPDDYGSHRTPEGAFSAANEAWHQANHTYVASLLLGAIIVTIGIMIALGFVYPLSGVLGGLLLTGMSIVTLSFLFTTPEAWVGALGTDTHGFPYLAGPGRLVVKDAIMLGASLWTAADSAKRFMRGRSGMVRPKDPGADLLVDRSASGG